MTAREPNIELCAERPTSYRVGPYVVDGRKREILKNGTRIPLSDTEFGVFYQIVEGKGGLVLREEFTACARQRVQDVRHPVDEHVSHLKKKLACSSIIRSERGKGYRLSPAFGVEIISEPSPSENEKQLSIILDQISDHTDPSFRAAIENCEDLLKADKIADAYAVLALAYINRGHVGFCRELPSIAIAKARKVIDEALRQFPSFGSAYALRGLATLIYDYDWGKAEADLEKSLELSPASEYGHCFLSHLQVAQGRFDEGLEHARIAANLDYGSPMTVVTEVWLMYFAERVGEAVIKGEQVLKRFAQCAPAHSILGHAYRAAGATERAIKQYELALEIEFLPEVHASLGFVYAQQGKRREAVKHLDAIYAAKESGKIAYVSGYFDALIYAGLGSTQKALRSLEQAFEERCDWLVHLGVEPRWKGLCKKKRFRNLMRRVGIKKYIGPD